MKIYFKDNSAMAANLAILPFNVYLILVKKKYVASSQKIVFPLNFLLSK